MRLALIESFVPAAGAEMPSESALTLAWASDRPPAGDESADRRLRFGAEVIAFSEDFTGAARSMLLPPPSLMAQVRRAMGLVEGIEPVHRKMMSNRGYEVTDAPTGRAAEAVQGDAQLPRAASRPQRGKRMSEGTAAARCRCFGCPEEAVSATINFCAVCDDTWHWGHCPSCQGILASPALQCPLCGAALAVTRLEK